MIATGEISSEWVDIAAIAACSNHMVGLKSDGTVVADGKNYDGRCDVSEWRNIISVAAGEEHTVGLKSDGTVVAVGLNVKGQCNVNDWTGIEAIVAGGKFTVGLKSDGTVVSTKYIGFKDDYFGQCDVNDWTDIVAIAAGKDHTVGLKMDGKVVTVGNNLFGQCNVKEWMDIVAVCASNCHTIGLKADGTVVVTEYIGDNEQYIGYKDISKWRDIIAVATGEYHVVGLKSNGTVVAVGNNYDGQCNVKDWKLFKTEEEKETDYNLACELEKTGVVDNIIIAVKMFNSLKNYKDSPSHAKDCYIALMKNEKTSLQTELSNLKGMFSGKRRKEIEARLAQIDNELKKL